MVQGDEQNVFAISQPDQPPARQRTSLQIEHGLAFLDGQPLQLRFSVAVSAQVMLLKRKPYVLGPNALNRLTVRVDEGGA